MRNISLHKVIADTFFLTIEIKFIPNVLIYFLIFVWNAVKKDLLFQVWVFIYYENVIRMSFFNAFVLCRLIDV